MGEGVVTVEELIKALKQIPKKDRANILVVIDDPSRAWWNHVDQVELPDQYVPGQAGYSAVSLCAGDSLDTRDF